MFPMGASDDSFDVELFAMSRIKGLHSFAQIRPKVLQIVDIARQIACNAILISRREVLDPLHGAV